MSPGAPNRRACPERQKLCKYSLFLLFYQNRILSFRRKPESSYYISISNNKQTDSHPGEKRHILDIIHHSDNTFTASQVNMEDFYPEHTLILKGTQGENLTDKEKSLSI